MEKIIKNKKPKQIMNRLFVVSFLILSFFSVSVVAQPEEVLRWQFEEGGGTIILDTSGNANHGTVLGGRWQTGTDAKFGTYGFDFDNNNDLIESITNFPLSNQQSISFWMKPDRNDQIDTLFEITDSLSTTFRFTYNNSISNDWVVSYNDTNGTLQTIIVDSFTPTTTTTWYHLILVMDFDNNNIKYYRDSTLISNVTMPTSIFINETSNKKLRVGGLVTNNFFDGDMDEFRFYNFILNTSQISQLQSNLALSIPSGVETNETPSEVVINGTQQFNIINTFTPINGSVVTIPFGISATLNTQATCDIYIDNEFYARYENTLAFNHIVNSLSLGEHNYFLYCSLIDGNNILNYELTNLTYFNVDLGTPSTIQFIFSSTDFNVNDLGLYVTSPCLKKGLFVPTISNGYNQIVNKQPVYIQRITNNYATFTINQGEHEFCLVNGRMVYDANNFTSGWKANDVYKNLKLGKYDIPNNITTSYVLSLENLDVWKPYNPKAWGQSWASLISSILAFLIGLGLIALGFMDRQNPVPQLILIGGLLVMFSLGYQISNLLLGVLF